MMKLDPIDMHSHLESVDVSMRYEIDTIKRPCNLVFPRGIHAEHVILYVIAFEK